MQEAQLLDGRHIAGQIHRETMEAVQRLRRKGILPCVVFMRVGNHPPSELYVRMKQKKAQEVGIQSEIISFPEDVSQKEVLDNLNRLNLDPSIHGILVQLPLPSHLSEKQIALAINPKKDIDGFHPLNLGKMLLGEKDCFYPCTPLGIQELLKRYKIEIEGKEVVILGRSNIVGKPLAALFLQKSKYANATVTVVHSFSQNIKEHCRQADILIAAMGKARFVTRDFVKPKAVVVDVGVSRIADSSSPQGYRIVGDVDFDEIKKIASWITPNPGGVGPMTIAMLLANTVKAAELSQP
ncbi:bifunctional 5,10-methylene-tetrahydrofolate dehydrogenase/5,10-methylene-tetrahydrofolate cyclohydrolase [Methylacidiphilum caldifontis]|uniref:bifunctional 5,10-methylenetetrahydrofolate dehydrogenase/5,10-methenyltetrahydrofolate cyclohydrolase n=1 Tax=Methylacidiphilum caldifontis TaxID=2795386 RepID=UPI001A8EB3A4|nr:tetrahydrofolate dehydrogenase/cyclohydrolase catalytic domain-containing protein [Methylacidiphilum caldifontis]QSR89148.1 bifunctional 5,10-methylene-tetrahydrofolate dehydrogenase/5,10-methylene-tetrahydrofolate cyclohydrolase [Methylacidiphilum caldifontis]